MAFQRRGWRYFATRLNGDGTETTIDQDLPLENVTIEDVLSGDNSLTGSIDPAYRRLKGPDGYPLLKAWSTAIYAEADGNIRAGAIVTAAEPDGSSLGLECSGFTNYGRDMPYTGSGYAGVKVDPLDVVRVIWSHIQSQRGGNIGLNLSTLKTGLSIGTTLQQVEFDTQSGPVSFEAGPVKLNWYETHDLMGMVDDLASQYDFDYHERHAWTPGDDIGHYLDFMFPIDNSVARNDLRFVYGVNVFEPPKIGLSGEFYASGALVLGSGDGPAMIHSLYEPPRQVGDPLRRIAVVEDSNIRSLVSAQKRAMAETQWRKRLEDMDTLVVRDHPNARLGAATVGDVITIEAREDWIETTLTVRILSISYQPANGNVAEYKVARTDKLVS